MLAIIIFGFLPLLWSSYAAPLSLKKLGLGAAVAASKTRVTKLLRSSFEAEFLWPAQLSRLAYCPSALVQSMKCRRGPCKDFSSLKVLQTGGDGSSIPLYFIASDSKTKTIVVSHQGTDSKDIWSIANDAKFGLEPINATIFPSARDGVKVHRGFQQAFLRTEPSIRTGVSSALKTTGFKKVLVTGHSLGAAIATLDILMLKMTLSQDVSLEARLFGLPRGGNQDFADLIDSLLGLSFLFVTNQNDPVPTVPPRFLQFQHSQGELHIKSTDKYGNPTDIISCTGQENVLCAEGVSLIKASAQNHRGPYLRNISMSHSDCPL